MTSYQLALFLHLFALLAATSASAVVHFAAGRRSSAPTLRQALDWGKVIARTSRIFPVAVVVLVATGAYMVAGRWSWNDGWVVAGVVGAVALLASGAVLGKRGAAEARAGVQRLESAGRDLPNVAAPDPVGALLGEANTGLALAIVLDMTLKPALVASLVVLAVGAAIGAYRGRRHLRAAAPLAGVSEAEAA